jgi:hypothetical protein
MLYAIVNMAGSLYIETTMVTIPGILDISGGGYLNDKGPGKKLTFRLIATSVPTSKIYV